MEIITPFGVHSMCKRCGECCEKGSPTLHVSDADLIKNGSLKYSDIFTIRVGELVYNNVDDEFISIDYETIKVKERPNGRVCTFYDESSKECKIYNTRPNQCRAYECWNTDKFMEFYNEEKLTREHVLHGMDWLMDIVEAHEKKCNYLNLTDIVLRVQRGADMVNDVFEIMEYDNTLRDVLIKEKNIPAEYLPVLLGRPIEQTIIMYGYSVETDNDGKKVLKAL